MRLEEEAIAKLNVGERLQLLEKKVINFCRQLMHFDHFAIRLLDHKTNKLELAMCVGLPTEAMEVELFAVPEGNGISGYVASTKRYILFGRKEKRSAVRHGSFARQKQPDGPHDVARQGHWDIPISNRSSRQHSLEDDRQFAEIFGRYVAVAAEFPELAGGETPMPPPGRWPTTSKRRSGRGRSTSIQTETALLMDDYISNDDMTARLEVHFKQCGDDPAKPVRKRRTILRQVARQRRKRSKDIDPLLASKQVLVADDEPAIRASELPDLLTRHGCQVMVAKDGAEAYQDTGIPEQAFDLVTFGRQDAVQGWI